MSTIKKSAEQRNTVSDTHNLHNGQTTNTQFENKQAEKTHKRLNEWTK